jgi:Na+-transporting methylmalonyl-CoA/oxaloacetate decarboxylase gamma subunit
MNNITMGFENIVAADGVGIAVTGMLIVFAALALIAIVIALIPKLLPLLEKAFPEEHRHHAPSVASLPEDHEKVLAAIAHALFHREAGTLPTK